MASGTLRLFAVASGTVLLAFFGCDGERGRYGTSGVASGQGGGFMPPPGPSGGPGPSSGSGGAASDDDVIPDPDAPCDANLDIDSNDPLDAAAAIGLCKKAENGLDWGLLDARWVLPDGSTFTDQALYDLGHGILEDFGALVPREGERFLALSSGTARAPDDPDWSSPIGFDKDYGTPSPAGFPKESPACPGVETGEARDGVALELRMKAPPDALGLGYDFDFYTFEWPLYVCSTFNDFFVALLDPPPAGQDDANISFDSVGNPVSVNNALLLVCGCQNGPPCDAPPTDPLISYECPGGTDSLSDTGFEGAAATGWLATRTPVSGDEVVSLRLVVYDSGDGLLDSTTIIDNLRWLGDDPGGSGTDPLQPK
ncbi:MAG: choice-of-anchor L domain-containing protein [Myxococcales bacterium]|nr:choice-of-anchor L domain-containing protein [Myxococcales bacterium]